ncbi:hydrogenase nickel incorporation protein HypB [Ammoniphilus sp. CFH 90114]|uniref:hydrogenase nickel incorporation protein HypB n=1 Tax=Ammoniphilus sp. CFH 90114 TaxID=2493665 RepID=UPI00100F9A5D|nr:hydrogenase nickel incorporation protein HypB [Ammoniphilus sp. CFH 90114]RXT07956.1 hydrogenase accessory protein HypB [Ammoniphilus sp. CFH 90114]
MKKVAIQRDVLWDNKLKADENREKFNQYSILTINLMSSPGSGKTTFLERTIESLQDKLRIGVIEGDVATSLDAERIASLGTKVIQINTHGACHLNSNMIGSVLPHFQLQELDCLLIENVGNLVCPAEFDLGEHLRITILSTTEGTDKVLKYPTVFQCADVVILNKIDLLPYVPFHLESFCQTLREMNPKVQLFLVSALRGEGMDTWINWLVDRQVQFMKKNEEEWRSAESYKE